MLLREFLRRYVSFRDISSDYAKQLNWTVDRLERFLGRAPHLHDLTDEAVNFWLDSLLASGLARRTIRGQRANLLLLWRAAHFDGLATAAPIRVKRISCPTLIPLAEPAEKVAELLAVARREQGQFRRSKVSRPAFWTAFILFIWESGLRLGDVLRVDQSCIVNGVLVLSQNKTGWPLIRPLSEECLRAIEAIDPHRRKLIFGDALSRSHVFKGFRRLAKASGFRGGTKKIRKSGATAVEAACPGAAMGYLGHKTHGLAYTYYVDPRLLRSPGTSPPPLAG